MISFVQFGILWGVFIGSLAGYFFLVKNILKDFSFLEKSILFMLAVIPYVAMGVLFGGILGWCVNMFDEDITHLKKYSLLFIRTVGILTVPYFAIRWFKE
jgi:hypothetical protein